MYKSYISMWASLTDAMNSALADENVCRKMYFFGYVFPSWCESASKELKNLELN